MMSDLSFNGVPIVWDNPQDKPRTYILNRKIAKKFKAAIKSGKPSTLGTLFQCTRKGD